MCTSINSILSLIFMDYNSFSFAHGIRSPIPAFFVLFLVFFFQWVSQPTGTQKINTETDAVKLEPITSFFNSFSNKYFSFSASCCNSSTSSSSSLTLLLFFVSSSDGTSDGQSDIDLRSSIVISKLGLLSQGRQIGNHYCNIYLLNYYV